MGWQIFNVQDDFESIIIHVTNLPSFDVEISLKTFYSRTNITKRSSSFFTPSLSSRITNFSVEDEKGGGGCPRESMDFVRLLPVKKKAPASDAHSTG